MPKLPFSKNEKIILFVIIAIKLAVHMATSTTYGLHRDAFLYIAQSEHLDWGFVSVPPLTALIIALHQLLFGDSVFALRLIPAFVGVINLFLVGLMVKEMGGKKLAMVIGLLVYLFSPAFLRSNALLQPVSLNQMFWLLSTYVILLIVVRKEGKYWLWLGVVAGFGFLAKYSIVFLFVGFLLALILSKERKWFKTKYPYLAMGIGFILVMPNLIWQYNHNWPVVHHMAELRETQLVHVEYSGFLLLQLLMNFNSILIWISGLVFLLVLRSGKSFRILGWTYFFTLMILLFSNGKAYYTLGLYPLLFAGGGVVIEKWFIVKYKFVPYVLLAVMIINVIPAIPFSIPVFSYEKMVDHGRWASKFGMKELLRWEDGEYYSLPQDYADMTGWEEMASNVANVYHSLSVEDRTKCIIYADSYGQAGAIHYYRKKYKMPEAAAISFNGSFVFWIPEYTSIEMAIYITENPLEGSDFFDSMELKAQVLDPYARDRGYVYLMTEPKVDLVSAWSTLREEMLSEYKR